MHVKPQEVKRAPILVVDDSATSLRKMHSILSEGGFANIRTTDDPTQALDVYKKLRPTVTMLDYHMPEMTGVDVFDALQEEFGEMELSVVFWTSASREELLSRALQRGAHDILRKDQVTHEEVRIRVKNLVKSQLRHDKLQRRKEELSQKIERRTRELSYTSLEAVARLVRAAEFRDNETGGHIKRIGLLSKTLGEKLGIDNKICKAMRYAAPMHDIGKIAVSDDILFKPDSLDDEEWAAMKKHTTFGAEILGQSKRPYLKFGHNIARYHHENWNGEGYPEGLEEDDIPLEARIAAVCDVFDAVMSDRPYKDPWPPEKAIDLIREEKGEQFDPDIAECFLQSADRMLEIREEAGDSFDHDDLVPDNVSDELFEQLIQPD